MNEKDINTDNPPKMDMGTLMKRIPEETQATAKIKIDKIAHRLAKVKAYRDIQSRFIACASSSESKG
jgi:hypothetical protein